MKIKNNLNVWKYKDYYPWYRPDKKIAGFFRRYKWAWQRAKYGFCDRDLWNLDYTLGNYIANTVSQLAKTTHGYPHGITEDKWTEILNGIAKDFYLGTDDSLYKNEYEDKINSNVYSLCFKSNKDLWKKYSERELEIANVMSAHRCNGFKELAKWFPHLWD